MKLNIVPQQGIVDPLARIRRQMRCTLAAGVPATIAALAWAWWPSEDVRGSRAMPPDQRNSTHAEDAAEPGQQLDIDVDQDSYAVRLWTPDPVPVAAVTAPPPRTPPPPPPRPRIGLQLLGIHSTGADGELRATLYDPQTDRLLIVATGERVGLFEVDAVTASGVGLRDEQGVRTLAIDAVPTATSGDSPSRGGER